MKIVIWGSRGSLPASTGAEKIREKICKAIEIANHQHFNSKAEIENFVDTQLPFSVRGSYGCNTSCVEIRDGEEFFVLDAGTGLRDFGNYVMQSGRIPARFHILMSHLHWDHIHGFPFFVPAFIKGNRIDFYGFHEDIEQAFIHQQEPPCFPVPTSYMQAEKHFTRLDPEKECEIAGFRVRGMEQHHPGLSYGYCLEKDGKKIVYSTDSEHKGRNDESYLAFFRNADVLIFDAQYSLTDAMYMKEDWGHSSNMMGVEMAIRSGVKHLCMYHSEPTHNDERLDRILRETVKYASIYDPSYRLKISLAFDGMEIGI